MVQSADELAVISGSPSISRPLSTWPRFEADELQAVEAVLRSGRVNSWTGDRTEEFEEAFAAYCARKYGVALANGTLALELALIALDIGPGDQVIVTARSFIASASCVLARGATPVFADVELDSGNVSAATIESCITGQTKAVIVVHLAGWPCDMDPICELARQHSFFVIEDCAQAHGALYKDRPVGSIGDAGCFSFCQDKIMTTGGEGGMLVLDDEAAWQRAWSFKDHGKSLPAILEDKKGFGFRWLHHSIGSNWRLTEMQAAIGICQLKKLAGWVTRRQENAAELSTCLNDYEAVRPPQMPTNGSHACYKLYTYVDESGLKPGIGRDWLRDAFCREGLTVLDGCCPEIYREMAFDDQPDLRPKKNLRNAEALGRSSLMFQVDHTLGNEEMKLTCAVVRKVMDFAAA